MANIKQIKIGSIAYDITAVDIIETNDGLKIKIWRGTKAEYDAIETKDEATIYAIINEQGAIISINDDAIDNRLVTLETWQNNFDDYELITTADIDTICGATTNISFATLNEGVF